MEALVAKVKQMGKDDIHAKKAWEAHCDSLGGGFRDPAKHDMAFLKAFVSSYTPGSWSEGGSADPGLVEEVKNLQKSDQDARAQWGLYCDLDGGGVRDPAKHDDAFLQTFLTNYNAGMQFEASSDSRGKSAELPPPPDNASQEDLVTHIKALQRNNESAKEQWRAYCDTYCEGTRDPSKQDYMTLQNFVKNYHSGSLAAVESPLVDLIKEGQRRSDKWKEAWSTYCESKGDGTRDPAKRDAAFISGFVDLMLKGFTMNPQVGKGKGSGKSMQAGMKRSADANAWAPAGKRANTRGSSLGGGSKEGIIERVKAFQRAGGSASWGEYCDSSFDGTRDPNKHPIESLNAFVSMYAVP